GGADPIHHWMTIPMLHFEPPASCVRRFWSGFQRLVDEAPGARILCATHSGPIRAFAAWAAGYDPGEPYNTEEVLVKLKEGGGEALVAYRNRVQEVQVPPTGARPGWGEALRRLSCRGWTATTRPSGPASAARTPASGSCWPPGCRCRPGSRSPSAPTTPSAATPRSAGPSPGCWARSTWATRPPWRN